MKLFTKKAQEISGHMKKNVSPLIKIGVMISTGVILGGIIVYLKTKRNHPDKKKIDDLKNLIKQSFELAQPSLCPLTQQKTKTLKDDNILMHITFISKLEDKSKLTVSLTKNPFLPPFQKGIMITQLLPKHRLLYNKFYFYKNHLIVATQEFEDQKNRVSIEDFNQTVLAMEAINGLFFFNSGPQSGYSQNHKHVQILPYDAFELPIIKKIIEDIKRNKLISMKQKQGNENILNFNGYKFIHGLIVMQQRIKGKNLEQTALQFKKAQQGLFRHLTRILKNQRISYNMIGCSQFLLIIPRKNEKIMDEIGVNAIGFMGSMLIKDRQIFEKIEHLCKPTDILRSIAFTEIGE